MGPSLQWHLGGGQGGIKHFIEHLLPPMVQSWKVLGTPTVTPELLRTLTEGVMREAAGRPVDQLSEEENETIIELFRVRAQHELRPQQA
jgi:hypothetical protein